MIISQVSYRTNGPLVIYYYTIEENFVKLYSQKTHFHEFSNRLNCVLTKLFNSNSVYLLVFSIHIVLHSEFLIFSVLTSLYYKIYCVFIVNNH